MVVIGPKPQWFRALGYPGARADAALSGSGKRGMDERGMLHARANPASGNPDLPRYLLSPLALAMAIAFLSAKPRTLV